MCVLKIYDPRKKAVAVKEACSMGLFLVQNKKPSLPALQTLVGDAVVVQV
jgi:hypothetical protein